MHTEPVEMHRGVLIYHDIRDHADEREQFHCITNGKRLTADTKAALRKQIDMAVSTGRG